MTQGVRALRVAPKVVGRPEASAGRPANATLRGPPSARGLDPTVVAALQGQAGNRAVCALLRARVSVQRDPPKRAKPSTCPADTSRVNVEIIDAVRATDNRRLFIALKKARRCFACTRDEYLGLFVGDATVSTSDLGRLWAASLKPMAGYVASGFLPSGRIGQYHAKLGFEVAADHKPAKAQSESLTAAAIADVYKRADVLFFTGHQFAQYNLPGVWGSSNYPDFDISRLPGPFPNVKLMVSTSCATLCKEAAAVFKALFPNATILGYKGSAPISGVAVSKAFSNAIPADVLIDDPSSGISEAIGAWKSTVAALAGTNSRPLPGWVDLKTGTGEVWDGNAWQHFDASADQAKCKKKDDWASSRPATPS
jgi:hypothetical protein